MCLATKSEADTELQAWLHLLPLFPSRLWPYLCPLVSQRSAYCRDLMLSGWTDWIPMALANWRGTQNSFNSGETKHSTKQRWLMNGIVPDPGSKDADITEHDSTILHPFSSHRSSVSYNSFPVPNHSGKRHEDHVVGRVLDSEIRRVRILLLILRAEWPWTSH